MSANTNLLLFALVSVAVLVLLIVRWKVSSFIALIAASVLLGLCAGMEPARFMQSFQDGAGGVLGSIAMIIALGAVLGRVLAETGGAEAIALRIAALFRPGRLPWAFLLMGFVVEVLPKIRTSGLNRKHTGNDPAKTKQADSPEVLGRV